MIHNLSVSALVALVGASRVSVNVHSQRRLGTSCEDLHTIFSNRLTVYQESLDAPESDISQTQHAMRTYGILRTLRRARTCSWVMDADDEDMIAARAIAQTFLSANPCAEAANAEMQTVSTTSVPEEQAVAVTHAMSILMSDTCESTQIPDDAVSFDEATAMDAQMGAMEDDVQDGLDEMMEASQGQEGSFVQLERVSLFRFLGVIFFLLFLMVVCSYAAYVVIFIVAYLWGVMLGLLGLVTTAGWLMGGMLTASGVSLVFPLAVAACAVEVYNNVIVTGRLN